MFPRYCLMDQASGAGGEGGAGAGGAGAAGAAGATPPWHGLTDPEAAAYVTNKGWMTPADVVKSYQSAEKLIGRDPNTLLVMPRPDDQEGFRAVMSKLGLPESPDKYEVHVPEGEKMDEAYVKWAKDSFHRIGLTAAQVKELTKSHNEYVGNLLKQQNTDYEQRVAADKSALIGEWRDGHERMINSAKASAKALGFTGPVMDAIERSIGYKETMKLFAGLGQKMSEDGFVSAETRTSSFNGMLTPAEAKAQHEAMQLDPTQRAALLDNTHPGHKAAIEKQTRLFKIMYPQ